MTRPTSKPTVRTSAVDAVKPAVKPTETTAPTPAEKPIETTTPTPEKKERKKPEAYNLDFAAIAKTVEDAPQPKTAEGAGRKRVDNSAVETWLRESWSNKVADDKMGKGKAVTVPKAAVATLRSRLNMAANTLKLGVAVQVQDLPDGMAKVIFAAKVRKMNKPKSAATPDATPATTPAK